MEDSRPILLTFKNYRDAANVAEHMENRFSDEAWVVRELDKGLYSVWAAREPGIADNNTSPWISF